MFGLIGAIILIVVIVFAVKKYVIIFSFVFIFILNVYNLAGQHNILNNTLNLTGLAQRNVRKKMESQQSNH